jgi:hypothetical protein
MNTKALVALMLLIVLAVVGVLGYQALTNARNSGIRGLNFSNSAPDDLVIYERTAYYRADDLAWINELNPQPARLVTAVGRTGIVSGFRESDATFLPQGTAIYSVQGRRDIVLALVNETHIPYYAE